MAYENSAGLGVHNQYGPRVAGGEQGVIKTEGYKSNYVLNLPASGLTYKFPVLDGTAYVSAIDLAFVTGTVTHIAVGGVAVYDSTTPVTLPVKIPNANTGAVVVTGGTSGDVIVEYKSVAL